MLGPTLFVQVAVVASGAAGVAARATGAHAIAPTSRTTAKAVANAFLIALMNDFKWVL